VRRVGETSVRALVRHPQFGKLLIGQAVSAFGDWMATVALMALVLDLTGSSTAVAAVLVLRLAPTAIAGPLATRFVARWHRRRTMLAMDLVRISIVFAIQLVRGVWWAYTWAFLLEVAGLIFLPARDAAIPNLADTDDVTLADSLVLASSYGMIPFGPDRPSQGQGETKDETERTSFLAAFRISFVRARVGPALVASLGIGALFSLGIVFVRDVLHASDMGFGILVVLFGVGAGAGLGLLRVLQLGSLRFVRWTIGAQGIVIAGMSAAPTVEVAFLGAFLFGATTAAALAAAMSTLQEHFEGPDRTGAFTVFHTLIRAGLAIAAIAAGAAADLLRRVNLPLVHTVDPTWLVLFASGVVVTATAIATHGLAARANSGARTADRKGTESRTHTSD
jgi:dTMP kinase